MTDTHFAILERHRVNWPESFDELWMPYAFALHRTHESDRQHADAVMARHGLTPAEFDVLATLRRSPPPGELTPSEIQHAMLITSGGLTKVLQQLETRGLITRTISESDRRSKPVHLSPMAVKLIEKAMSELMAVMSTAIKERLSEKEIKDLVRLLNKARLA